MDQFPASGARRGVSCDVTGMIHLDGHVRPVLYRMQGISLLPDAEGRRLFAGPVRWYTDDPDLLWLNDRWGAEEGEIDLDALRFRTRAHLIHPDPPTTAKVAAAPIGDASITPTLRAGGAAVRL